MFDNNYSTKWVTLENTSQKFEIVHYKTLDGNRVIISFYETKNLKSGNVVNTTAETTEYANELITDLLDMGWKATRVEVA